MKLQHKPAPLIRSYRNQASFRTKHKLTFETRQHKLEFKGDIRFYFLFKQLYADLESLQDLKQKMMDVSIFALLVNL